MFEIFAMANRSYIYGLKDNSHFGIGECPYNIPYAYQVLAAYDNEVVDSHLFDTRVGIVANFAKGRKHFIGSLIICVMANVWQIKVNLKNGSRQHKNLSM